MPMKGKTFRPRKSKPRFRRRKPTTTLNRALQPMASRYICKMKYAQTFTTDANGRYTFRLNSIFNPDATLLPGTGASHQPYGHDQMLLFYNRYRVISCGYRIQAISPGNSIPIQVAAIPANGTHIFVNVSEMKENPRAKYVVVNAGDTAKFLSSNCYIPALMGRTKTQYMSDDLFAATMGTNPGELAILNILTNNISDVGAAFTLNILLEYTVELYDPKNVQQS